MTPAKPTSGKIVDPRVLFCSFCRKSQHDVKTLIAGPNSFICEACVELCNDIVEHGAVRALLAEDHREGGQGTPRVDAYLAECTTKQLRIYVAKIEADLQRNREGIRSMDDALEARAERRQPGPAYRDVTDEELARRRGQLNKQLGATLAVFDIVAKALELRE